MNDSSKYLTVTALTRYIKYKIDSDEHLRQVFLRGEISNFKSHTTGHLYFSLKDETSKINAIMFNTKAKKIEFKPADGMKVLIVGRISVYEATGNYQIYVDEMIQDGVGNLYLEFEKLKKIIAEVLNVDEDDITMETTFVDDLGADSLDLYEMIMAMEEKYDITIPEEELKSIHTINDVMEILSANGVEE